MHVLNAAAAAIAALCLSAAPAAAQTPPVQFKGILPSSTINQMIADIAATKLGLAAKLDASRVGQPSGVASLDAAGQVVLSGTAPLAMNSNPTAEAPSCSATAAQVSVRNSLHSHVDLLLGMFGPQGHTCDGLQAILSIVPNSTATQSNAVAGYVWNTNNNHNGGFANGVGVALNGGAVNTVDGTQSWLLAGVASDIGTQGTYGRLMQSEFDYKPMFVNTQVSGFMLAMDSPIQASNADGYIIATTAGNPAFVPMKVGKWNNGFRCYDGSVNGTCLLVGLSASTAAGVPASTQSQQLGFQFTDAGSVPRIATLNALPDKMSVGRADAAPYDFATSGYLRAALGVKVGVDQVLAGRQAGWGAITGIKSKAAFDSGSASPLVVAQTLAALLADLTFHGMIGP